MLLDIHTHHCSAIAGESIQQIDPTHFVPIEGRYYAAGIHPWQVAQANEAAWLALDEAVQHPAVLAIGEAGLDRLATTPMSMQETAFIRHILLSETVRKPLVIHCVKAFNELVVLKRRYRPSMPWIVHGFRNNLHIARLLIHEEIYVSLGEKYQKEVLLHLPPTRLLTETDESNCPIEKVIAHVATDLGIASSALCRQIDENARNIFFRS